MPMVIMACLACEKPAFRWALILASGPRAPAGGAAPDGRRARTGGIHTHKGRLGGGPCGSERRSSVRSALGELLAAAGLVEADLLALDFPRIAGHEPGLRQRRLERRIIID